MEAQELLFDGNEKQILSTGDPAVICIRYKDVATAFNGIKRADFPGKGALNNAISSMIFEYLASRGIQSHFISTFDENSQLCRKVDDIPLQVIVRNYIAGTTALMLGVEEGMKPENVVYELRYNNDRLGDPLINEHHAVALGLVTYDEFNHICGIASAVNEALKELFAQVGIILVDLKLEFGRTADGEIILCDEISPDNTRLWDSKSLYKLDKDRFRHDLGYILDGYRTVYERLFNYFQK